MRDVSVLRKPFTVGLDRRVVVVLEQPQTNLSTEGSEPETTSSGCAGETEAVSTVDPERAEHTGSGERERGLGRADERERGSSMAGDKTRRRERSSETSRELYVAGHRDEHFEKVLSGLAHASNGSLSAPHARRSRGASARALSRQKQRGSSRQRSTSAVEAAGIHCSE
jgi:hypothetical protein